MCHMISCARLAVLSALVLAGCQTARDVAVTSFRVLDAPAHYIRQKIDQPETTTTTTTTERYTTSDVTHPGEPVSSAPQPTPPPRETTSQRRVVSQEPRPAHLQPSPAVRRTETTTVRQTPKSSPTPRVASKTSPEFPTARPVPGQPGHVYSIDPKGGIVDVTGYKKGDKAKDPYTQQIFIVP